MKFLKWRIGGVIYHIVFKKWIITNDMNQHGLKEDAKNILIIGFSDTLDAAMFLVYEHQVSLKLEITVMDDIRKNKKKLRLNNSATNTEWTGWQCDKKTSKVAFPIERVYFDITSPAVLNQVRIIDFHDSQNDTNSDSTLE